MTTRMHVCCPRNRQSRVRVRVGRPTKTYSSNISQVFSELSRQSNVAYLLRRLPVGVVLEQRRQRGPRRRPHVRRRHGEGRGQREDEERQRRHGHAPASCRHGQQLALVLCCLNLDGSTARNRKWKEDMRTAGPGRGVVSRAGIYKHTQRPARSMDTHRSADEVR